jgi:hypothetical protein
MNSYIVDIMAHMLVFQSQNLIKRECITNVQYLYDCIKMNAINHNAIVKAVMVLNHEDRTFKFIAAHLVIELDGGQIIDPSYEVFELKNRRYYDNIKNMLDSFDKSGRKTFIKKCGHAFDDFKKINETANKINSGMCLIHDKKFYNAQADYVNKAMLLTKN